MQKAKGAPAVRDIGIAAQGLADWDTGLLIFLADTWKFCAEEKIRFTSMGLPQGVKNLLELATAVPEKKDARKAEQSVSFLTHLGNEAVGLFRSSGDLLEFVGKDSKAPSIKRESVFHAAASSAGITKILDTQNQTLTEFSRDLAKAIQSLPG